MKVFTRDLTGDPAVLVKKAESAARCGGASFQGDASSGRFSGSGVAGRYEISGGQVTVTIESKPFYAPWSVVERTSGQSESFSLE